MAQDTGALRPAQRQEVGFWFGGGWITRLAGAVGLGEQSSSLTNPSPSWHGAAGKAAAWDTRSRCGVPVPATLLPPQLLLTCLGGTSDG